MTKRLPPPARPPLPDDALLQMMAQNPWVPSTPYREGLINWRHYAAAALRDVQIEAMADPFCDVIERLEHLTTRRLIEQVEDAPPGDDPFGIDDWHGVWAEHFVSWQDPVRDLVDAMAFTPDAKDFTGRLQMADGEVFLDFVLDAHLNWSAHQAMALRAGLPHHAACERFPLTVPHSARSARCSGSTGHCSRGLPSRSRSASSRRPSRSSRSTSSAACSRLSRAGHAKSRSGGKHDAEALSFEPSMRTARCPAGSAPPANLDHLVEPPACCWGI